MSRARARRAETRDTYAALRLWDYAIIGYLSRSMVYRVRCISRDETRRRHRSSRVPLPSGQHSRVFRFGCQCTVAVPAQQVTSHRG